ncbi:hypothetical protein M501DRAFT_1029016 [Patellaria atrata CBS 101060]|uniref:Uncharacterized protein n=1 Tax=Patellaria atrata CBS 101060 TaxID=1346257 RepID=A0A9P4VUS1_9PEZI|nr:hypothetical protein M501DRAFT_1029016 [Patellaria atrata CBS 101060]
MRLKDAFVFLGLIGVVIADETQWDDSACSGCEVGCPDGIGTVWTTLYTYLVETVYIQIDNSTGSTTTLSVEPNPDARSSFSYLSSSAEDYLIHHYGNPGGVADGTVIVDTFMRGSQQLTMTYPTSYLRLYTFDVRSTFSTTQGSTSICTTTWRTFGLSSFSLYTIDPSDTSWLTPYTYPEGLATFLGTLPYKAYITLDDGRLISCTPGRCNGIPTTKIPIVGTKKTITRHGRVVETAAPEQASSAFAPGPVSTFSVTTSTPAVRSMT